jgi:hypothetical protein
MIRLEHPILVRAPKQKVYDWWTDFQETDPSLSGRIIRRRKLVSKSPTEVIYEDGRMPGVSYKDRVRVRLFPPNKWIAEYHSNKFDATSIYSLKELMEEPKWIWLQRLNSKAGSDHLEGLQSGGVKRTIEKGWDEYLGIVEEESRKG